MGLAKYRGGLAAISRQRERDPGERRNGGPGESALIGLLLGPMIKEVVMAAVKEAMAEALSDTASRRAARWVQNKLTNVKGWFYVKRH